MASHLKQRGMIDYQRREGGGGGGGGGGGEGGGGGGGGLFKGTVDLVL